MLKLLQTYMCSIINIITPVRALNYLIQPKTPCARKIVLIAACVLGVFILPTILGHIGTLFWKDRSVNRIETALSPPTTDQPKIQCDKISDVSSRIQDFPEIYFWMANQVGPFKPIGYEEWDFSHAASGIQQQQKSAYGSERAKELENIKNDLCREARSKIIRYDNIIEEGTFGPYVYNEEALFALLQKNVDRLIDGDLKTAVKNDQKSQSTKMCAQSLKSFGNPYGIPQALIDAAFGDISISQLPAIALPDTGVSELLGLYREFPRHTWQTIRNFLVYFHRNGRADYKDLAQKLLQRIPQPKEGMDYFIYQDQVYSTRS